MSKIPVTELPMARTIIRFARVHSFKHHQWNRDGEHCELCGASDWMLGGCIQQRTWPIQWHSEEHEREAFSMYNAYSTFAAQPEVGHDGSANEKVFNWLLEEAMTDLVDATTNGEANVHIQISYN